MTPLEYKNLIALSYWFILF